MYSQNDPYNPYNQGNQPVAILMRLFSLGLGLIVLLAGIGLLVYLLILGEPLIPSFSENDLNLEMFKPLMIASMAGVAGLAGIMLIIGPRGRRVAGRIIRGIYTVVIVLVIAGVLFWSFFINPHVSMTSTGFTRTSVSITEGDTLHFENPADGVTQILCTGVDQQCKSNTIAPDSVNQGIKIAPGQTVDVTFPEVGTLTITSKNTPHMNITIRVNTHHSSTSSHTRHRR